MKTLPLVLSAGLALTCLAACIMPPSMLERSSWGPPPEYWQENGRYRADDSGASSMGTENAPESSSVGATTSSQAQPAPRQGGDATLYAWDGGVVDGAPQGVSTAQGTPRGIETPAPGRTHIVELYQQVKDDRDALAEEVELLRKSLEQTTLAFEEETRKSNDLLGRLAALEVSHREMMEDNQAIAARLVQAQIRRLEAEKMLLETRIELEKQKEVEAAQAAAAVRGAAGKPGAKPKSEKSVARDEQ